MCSVQEGEPVVPVVADGLVGPDLGRRLFGLVEEVPEAHQAALRRGLRRPAPRARPSRRCRSSSGALGPGQDLGAHGRPRRSAPAARCAGPGRPGAAAARPPRSRAGRAAGPGSDRIPVSRVAGPAGDRVAQRLGVGGDGGEGDRAVGEELGVVLRDRRDDPAPRRRARGRSARSGWSGSVRASETGCRFANSGFSDSIAWFSEAPRAAKALPKPSRTLRLASRVWVSKVLPMSSNSVCSLGLRDRQRRRPPGARCRRRRARSPGT